MAKLTNKKILSALYHNNLIGRKPWPRKKYFTIKESMVGEILVAEEIQKFVIKHYGQESCDANDWQIADKSEEKKQG